MKIFIFIAVISLSTSSMAQFRKAKQKQDMIDQSEKTDWTKILENYEALQSVLREKNSQELGCTPLANNQFSKQCSFKNFCQVFNANQDKPYLYVSKDGKKVPNYGLAQLGQMVRACYVALEAVYDKAGLKIDSRKGEKPTMDPTKAYYIKVQKTQIALLQEVQNTGADKAYVKFTQAVAEMGLAKIETNAPLLASGEVQSRDYLKQKILEIEKNSGIELPASVREKFIDSTIASQEQPVETTIGTSDNSRKTSEVNPFVDMNLFSDIKSAGSKDKALENHAKVQSAYNDGHVLFKETQSDILKILDEKIKKNPKLKNQYEQMKLRISTISYHIPKDVIEMATSCPGPNAFYDPLHHNFILCPQVLELPKAGLKKIIAHELGHSIDPCILSQDLLKVDEIAKRANPNELTDEMKKKYEASGWLIEKFQGQKIEGRYIVNYLGYAKDVLQVEYSNQKNASAGKPVLLKDNPEAKVINCLSSTSSINARKSSKDESKKDLDDAISKIEQSGGASAENTEYQNLVEARKNFDKYYDELGACSFLPGNSQQQEAWSDWLAGEVMGNDIKKLPKEEKQSYAFESIGFDLATTCQSAQQSDTVKATIKFLTETGCAQMDTEKGKVAQIESMLNASAGKEDSHNHFVDRVQKLMMANPEIKSALDCGQSVGGKHCE